MDGYDFEFTERIAARFADLWAIEEDLDHVHAAIEFTLVTRVREMDRTAGGEVANADNDADGERHMIARAVWESAAISYRRCFSSGASLLSPGRSARPRLTDWRDDFPDELRPAHDRLLEQANRHYAHRVNGSMKLWPIVHLASSGKWRVTSVNYDSTQEIRPELYDILLMKRLVKWLRDRILEEVDAEEQLIIASLNPRIELCYAMAATRPLRPAIHEYDRPLGLPTMHPVEERVRNARRRTTRRLPFGHRPDRRFRAVCVRCGLRTSRRVCRQCPSGLNGQRAAFHAARRDSPVTIMVWAV